MNITILDYINYLVEVCDYSEEDAEICADALFNVRFGEDD